jgi:hypothetical protein
MARPMTPAERLVGRRMPPAPRHMDTLMASFVTDDGTSHGRMAPDESWLKPAHLKARRSGWIRHSGIVFKMQGERGSGTGLWFPTDKGISEAVEARARVKAIEEARREWAREHHALLIGARDSES